jgi:hypothetical protein
MARSVLQVRLSEEEKAKIQARVAKGELSDYVRSTALAGIAPDIATELRLLLQMARKGGRTGAVAQDELLFRLAQLLGLEDPTP